MLFKRLAIIVLTEFGCFSVVGPGARRAFLSASDYREPQKLTYHAPAWRRVASDSVVVRPLLFMVALIWRAEFTNSGMEGELTITTDEVGAHRRVYSFQGLEIPCGFESLREHDR